MHQEALYKRLIRLEAEIEKPNCRVLLNEISKLHSQRNIARLKLNSLVKQHDVYKKRLNETKKDYDKLKQALEGLNEREITKVAIHHLKDRKRKHQEAKNRLFAWEERYLSAQEALTQELVIVEEMLKVKKHQYNGQ